MKTPQCIGWTFVGSVAVATVAVASDPQGPTYWSEVELLTHVDAAQADELGRSVAVDGNTMIAGAPIEDNLGGQDAGSAHVFVQSGGSWQQEVKLRGLDTVAFDFFGQSLDIEGDTALIGAPGHDAAALGAGAAYVFRRLGTNWAQQAKLLANEMGANDRFGEAVALDGGTAVIGAPQSNVITIDEGLAYVFTVDGGAWSEQARLEATQTQMQDWFGSSVAICGETVVIGARFHDGVGGLNSGAAYVFVRSGTSWSQEAQLLADDASVGDEFGYSVAVDGDTALVGAPTGTGIGGAYVFERTGTTWTQARKLIEPGANRFGGAVELVGDRAAIARRNDLFGPGSVFLYDRLVEPASVRWVLRNELTGSHGFGKAIGFSGELLGVGLPALDVQANDSGAVSVFERVDPHPTFCNASDGALTACPCANAGAPDTGCDLQSGSGGVGLDVAFQSFVPLNRATLSGTGFPSMGSPTALVIRADTLETAPVAFGDGLRCVGLPVVRLAATFATGGTATAVVVHGAMAGPGLFYYQLWFRDQPAMFCTPAAFNLSSGRTICW